MAHQRPSDLAGWTPLGVSAYSPELQPAERLWSILDQPIANRTFDTTEHLEQAFANVNDNYSSGVHIKDSLG